MTTLHNKGNRTHQGIETMTTLHNKGNRTHQGI